MIPRKCDSCGLEQASKRASMYWAWTNANGQRRAYKQLICTDCWREQVLPLVARAMEPVLICPMCGESTADGFDAVYLTYCLPGQAKDQSEMPLCGSCAVKVRNVALTGSLLPDREATRAGAEFSAPASNSRSVWDELGLRPERREP